MGGSRSSRAGAGRWATAIAASLLVLGLGPPASADLMRGIGSVIAGVFEIPRATLAGTMNGPPLIGTLVGALGGTLNAISLLTSGLFDLAGSAVTLGVKAAPFVLPFIFL